MEVATEVEGGATNDKPKLNFTFPDDDSIPFLLGRAISEHLSQMESVFVEQCVAPRSLAFALPHPLSHNVDSPPFPPTPAASRTC